MLPGEFLFLAGFPEMPGRSVMEERPDACMM